MLRYRLQLYIVRFFIIIIIALQYMYECVVDQLKKPQKTSRAIFEKSLR